MANFSQYQEFGIGAEKMPEIYPDVENLSKDLLIDEYGKDPNLNQTVNEPPAAKKKFTPGEKTKLSYNLAPGLKKQNFSILSETISIEAYVDDYFVQYINQELHNGNQRSVVRFKRGYLSKESKEKKFYTYDMPPWIFEQLVQGIELVRGDEHYQKVVEHGNNTNRV